MMINRRRLGWVLVCVAALALVWVAPSAAEGGVTFAPSQLAIAGQRGAVETRTLLLRATETITSLQVVPLDLERSAPGVVFPAGKIMVALSVDHIEAGDVLTVPVTVDLRGVRSGAFSGDLLLHYHGGSLSVPLTVTVKDPPYLALGVLVLGVALGMGVSAYRTQGRPRDELLALVGQYSTQIKADKELLDQGKPFYERFEAELVDVDMALRAKNWEEAQRAVGDVEALWARWRKGRADWLELLKYYQQLKQLADGQETTYTKTLLKAAEDLHRSLPDLAGPDAFRIALDDLSERLNRFVALQARIDAVKSAMLQKQLHELAYNDDAGFQTLTQAVEAAEGQAGAPEMIVKGIPTRGGEMAQVWASGAAAVVRALMGAPAVTPRTFEQEASVAGSRLHWFKVGSYLIAVLLLAGAGFGELYVGSAAFGASPWSDYFALLAWGFGAEATRAAVTDLVKSWGMG